MTIGGWFILVFIWVMCVIGVWGAWVLTDKKPGHILAVIVAVAVAIGSVFLMRWYFTSTASGIRALTDQKSNLSNGLDRTITIYTANGDKLAEYRGKIDIEMDQDYIKFDYEGKRYIYYNCFVETIADIQ